MKRKLFFIGLFSLIVVTILIIRHHNFHSTWSELDKSWSNPYCHQTCQARREKLKQELLKFLRRGYVMSLSKYLDNPEWNYETKVYLVQALHQKELRTRQIMNYMKRGENLALKWKILRWYDLNKEEYKSLIEKTKTKLARSPEKYKSLLQEITKSSSPEFIDLYVSLLSHSSVESKNLAIIGLGQIEDKEKIEIDYIHKLEDILIQEDNSNIRRRLLFLWDELLQTHPNIRKKSISRLQREANLSGQNQDIFQAIITHYTN